MLTETELKIHAELGIPAGYGEGGMPPYFPEATRLADAGPNLMGRPQRLVPEALDRWRALVAAAADADVQLLMVSGFRSVEYQASLIRKKLEAGEAIEDILRVNAAPGFSQHQTGAAIDIAAPGSRPLTEEFEQSPAFAWLTANAGEFGFVMSYPRDNSEGFVYEPWHWALVSHVTY